MDYFLYIVYKVFKFIVLLLPKKLVKLFLDSLSYLVYLLNKEHKTYAKKNLDFVFDTQLQETEKWKIVRETYRNIFYNLYEFIENQTLDLQGFENKIDVINEHYILDALKENRKIILITAHYGNWEYGNTFVPLKYRPTTMVGRPMNNKYFNDELNATRTRNNTQMLTKNEAGRGLVKALKSDRIVGMVIDQHNGIGIDVEFLGHKVKQADSASRLAVKFDAIILPLFFTCKEFGKYEAEFLEPIEPKSFEGENQILQLTQKQADVMTAQIKKYPEQWFWQHKRFKEYNKEIYG
jgi:KDO2-lipid IV(A) lauroyltransferase